MDRVRSPDHIVVDGKRRFYDGDPHPQPDRPATVLQAEFLNAVQEELCGFIEEHVELSHGNCTGLARAVEKVIEDKLAPLKKQIDLIWEEIAGKAENDEQ